MFAAERAWEQHSNGSLAPFLLAPFVLSPERGCDPTSTGTMGGWVRQPLPGKADCGEVAGENQGAKALVPLPFPFIHLQLCCFR